MFQLITSALLILLCLVCLRWYAGVKIICRPLWVVALDAAPVLLGATMFTALTARPLLGVLLVTALAGGLIAADVLKRTVLQEPVVFADRAELLELLRHPEFYLPFAGTGMMVTGAFAIVALSAAVAWVVPPLWPWSPWAALAGLVLAVAAFHVPTWPFALTRLQARYERLMPYRRPEQDIPRWGILACLVIHATLARAERPIRRAAPAILHAPGRHRPGPVVMAQLESFFDPRRLHPAVPRDLLPGWDTCCAEAAARGRLGVPTWGANTIRTEFAALTGFGPAALGLDRFNAYERLARRPVDSVAWRMRSLGFRTVCLHPFDKTFYGRHRALPALGFQHFIGPEAFARRGRDGFVSDAALAEKAAEILAEAGSDLFLFVISVGNHGPWLANRGPEDAFPLPAALQALPEARAWQRYLGGLRRTDRFFLPMMQALRAAPGQGQGVLLAYGDHQPSMPGLFASLGHDDTDTDYVIWEANADKRAAVHPTPLAVEALPQMLLDQVAARYVSRDAARYASGDVAA